MTPPAEWRLETVETSVAELHALDVSEDPVRTLRTCHPTDVTVVLGRSQDASLLDAKVLKELGIDIVRRNSGGGMVLVEPTSMCWFDVVVPKGDALWTEDVGAAFHWLGDAVARALQPFGMHDVQVHKGAMERALFAREVCFLSLGPGEIVNAGRKIVGISQRRRRSGAVFHCSVLTAPDAQDVSDLTVLGREAQSALARRLQDFVGWVPDFDLATFETAFVAELDRL